MTIAALPDSALSAQSWFCCDGLSSCHQHADAGVSKVLIGNKCDMVGKIQVTEAEGRALADKYGIPFFLASAKNNINVTEVMPWL